MKVQLKAGQGLSDLTEGNVYRVLGIEAGDLRIVSDEGRPFLFPRDSFEVVDPDEPRDWMTTAGADGERYAYPPQLRRPGFRNSAWRRALRK